jgi:hypothetical protein
MGWFEQAEAYTKIGAVQARAGDAGGAKASFGDALAAANKAHERDERHDLPLKSEALAALAAAQAATGDSDAAKATAVAIDKSDQNQAKAYARDGAAEALVARK